jgi:ABC-type dipeptide/oligopeptide/nickel transport system ATPase subunit
MNIISFTGKKGHGKSTACNELVRMYRDRVVRINFKDALVSTMKEKMPGVLYDLENHYGMTVEQLFNEKPPVMRRVMQFVGTEIYRELDPNYWVNRWIESVVKYDETDKIIVTDDVRFNNEFSAVVDLGGTVIKLVATNKPVSNDQHQSEI